MNFYPNALNSANEINCSSTTGRIRVGMEKIDGLKKVGGGSCSFTEMAFWVGTFSTGEAKTAVAQEG